jgi:hypothetical protein
MIFYRVMALYTGTRSLHGFCFYFFFFATKFFTQQIYYNLKAYSLIVSLWYTINCTPLQQHPSGMTIQRYCISLKGWCSADVVLYLQCKCIYFSRVVFYGNLFQSLFTAESVFQTEAGKVSIIGREYLNSYLNDIS